MRGRYPRKSTGSNNLWIVSKKIRGMNMDGQDRNTRNAWPSAWMLGGCGDRGVSCSFFLCGLLRLFYHRKLKKYLACGFLSGQGIDQVAAFECRDTIQIFSLEMESFCSVKQGIADRS